MIKIEIIGPNGENLLGGTVAERVRKLGLPAVGLLGGMVLSFFLANSLVTSESDTQADASQEALKTFSAGVSYPLPTMQKPDSEAVAVQAPQPITPSNEFHTLARFTGNKTVIGPSNNSAPSKKQVAGLSPPKTSLNLVNPQAVDSDPLLDERIQAAKEWLAVSNNDAMYSVQLMSVHRSSLGGLKSYLSRSNISLSTDKLMAFPVDQERLLLFYGQYASREEANQAIASLPVNLRNTGPFVLTGKNIQGKLVHLTKDTGKQVGLVATLKQ